MVPRGSVAGVSVKIDKAKSSCNTIVFLVEDCISAPAAL